HAAAAVERDLARRGQPLIARDEGGMAAVTTIALLPLLLVVLAGVLQLGALRVSAARVRSAADLAVLVAVNDQDDAELASTGRLRLASDAATVAREYFARELELSAPLLASPAEEVAAAADVAAYPIAPAVDARTGARYDKIGRASCRERVEISEGEVAVKKTGHSV